MGGNEIIYYALSPLNTSVHAGSVLYSSAIDFRGTELYSLFCCGKIYCLFPNTNKWGDQASRQVLRTFPHKSNICAYCSSRLQKLERRRENSKLHYLFYGMENTAADHYCSEVRLAMNMSGLDGEHHNHADESRFPKRSSAQFTKFDGEWRIVELLQWLNIPQLRIAHPVIAISLLHSRVPRSLGVRLLLCKKLYKEKWTNSPCHGDIIRLSLEFSYSLNMCLCGI